MGKEHDSEIKYFAEIVMEHFFREILICNSEKGKYMDMVKSRERERERERGKAGAVF